MIKSKYITAICMTAIAAAVLFTCVLTAGRLSFVSRADADLSYADKLFDTSYVHSINIIVDDNKWQDMLDNASDEEYIGCDITIDGTTLKNVGIRPKGNTSLSNVKNMDSERYSFKIKFDKYEDGQKYLGLDKLCLNNIIQDNTYMKDYFSYRMMNEIGADAPLCSYSYIKVNNGDWGLYLAVEAIDTAFAQRTYGSDSGKIYKPESMEMSGGGKGPQDMPNGGQPPEMGNVEQPQGMPNGERPPKMEDGGKRRSGFGGKSNSSVALLYQGEDPENYSAILDNAVFDTDAADEKRLIQAIKQLNEGENLSDTVNTDEVLRYFVAHNFVVNFDSYTGNMMHNYYLYENSGKLSMIAWDYNLAFGGFGGGFGGRAGKAGEAAGDTAEQSVNYPIDTPVSGASLEDRPILGKLLENDEYLNEYHRLFSEFLNKYIDSGEFEQEYSRVYTMISKYVLTDPTKFCTYDEFAKGAETLKNFVMLRAESVHGQLSGTIPSTSQGQAAVSVSLIDVSDIKLSDMGSMNAGGRK